MQSTVVKLEVKFETNETGINEDYCDYTLSYLHISKHEQFLSSAGNICNPLIIIIYCV